MNQMSNGERDFQKLHHTFRAKILRYLTRLVGEHEAEDLTQEVFLRVSQALKNFKGRSQLSTWIYRIATHAAIDRLRSPSFKSSARKEAPKIPSAEIEVEVEEKDVSTGLKPSSIEEALIRKEMWECIREFVEKLPVSYRTVVVLSDLEGVKNNEIAKILGISLATVKIRLHRGRSMLRKEFETHCGLYRDARNELAWDGERP
jgi:RNA polymerase sigma-70 factor (ECF subfamily)